MREPVRRRDVPFSRDDGDADAFDAAVAADVDAVYEPKTNGVAR